MGRRTMTSDEAARMSAMAHARHTAARNLDALAGDHPEHAAHWREIGLSLLLDPAMPASAIDMEADYA